MRRFDLTVELHVLAKVELVRNKIQIAKVFRLAGEALFPVPLIQQFLRKRVAVGVALGVEAGSRIAVPVPGSTQITRRIEHGGVDPAVGKQLDLVDPGYACSNDDYLVVRLGSFHSPFAPMFAHCLKRTSVKNG